jgi:hypothetical protein
MSVAEAIREARAAGVDIGSDGNDLVLQASARRRGKAGRKAMSWRQPQ